MRKSFIAGLFIAVLVTFVAMSLNAVAAEVQLNAKIDSAVTKLDKNGSEYVRFLITEPRKLNGVDYTITLPVMSFGANVQFAKEFKNGDDFKAIVQKRFYQGRDSYTVIQFIN